MSSGGEPHQLNPVQRHDGVQIPQAAFAFHRGDNQRLVFHPAGKGGERLGGRKPAQVDQAVSIPAHHVSPMAGGDRPGPERGGNATPLRIDAAG